MQKNRFLRVVHVNKLVHLIYIRTIPCLHVEHKPIRYQWDIQKPYIKEGTARQYNEIKKINRKTNNGR